MRTAVPPTSNSLIDQRMDHLLTACRPLATVGPARWRQLSAMSVRGRRRSSAPRACRGWGGTLGRPPGRGPTGALAASLGRLRSPSLPPAIGGLATLGGRLASSFEPSHCKLKCGAAFYFWPWNRQLNRRVHFQLPLGVARRMAKKADDQIQLPTHGAAVLPSVKVDSYNLEVTDEEG